MFKKNKTVKIIKVSFYHEIPNNFTGIVEYPSQTKVWLKEGKRHREDGPAVIYSGGGNQWWIDGNWYPFTGPVYIQNSNGTFSNAGTTAESLIQTSIYLGKEKGRYNLEWLRFLTEEGIEEFPIIPGMELDKNFKNSFEKLGIKP